MADGNTLALASPYTFDLNVYTTHTVIYVSTNSGATWVTNLFSDDEIIYTLACSADGKQILAGPGPNPYLQDHIFISTNYGTTWMAADSPTNYWHSICSSADGDKLLAVVPGGGIWTVQSTPSPNLQVTLGKNSVALGWTVPSTNFVLQQNLNLTTTNWSDVTNIPVLDFTNLQNQVTVPLPAGSSFYRLKTH